jgi:hypothetical protein
MPAEPVRTISSVEELRQAVELSEVFLAEEHSARKGKSSVGFDKIETNAENPAQIALDIKVAPTRLVFRVTVVHESLAARVMVEYEAAYSSRNPITVPRGILDQFARIVLTNTLFPLARNSIYSAWARLGVRSKHLSLLKGAEMAESTP